MSEITKPEIKTVTLSRLHNLGNYEHIKYEVTVDVNGEPPGLVISVLEQALADLQAKSPHSEWDLRRAKEALEKPASELDEHDLHNLDLYKRRLKEHEEIQQRRNKARNTLNNLGLSSEYTDAKENWDDQF